MDITFINGFARSGKTSVLSYLTEQGYSVFSTSGFLDEIAVRYIQTFFESDLDCQTINMMLKNKMDDCIYTLTGMNCRALKIAIAEDFLVPIYGREVALVTPIVEKVFSLPEGTKCFVETIGGEEFNSFVSLINKKSSQPSTIKTINLISDEHQENVDIRKLFENPDLTLTFNKSLWYAQESSEYRQQFTEKIIGC